MKEFDCERVGQHETFMARELHNEQSNEISRVWLQLRYFFNNKFNLIRNILQKKKLFINVIIMENILCKIINFPTFHEKLSI